MQDLYLAWLLETSSKLHLWPIYNRSCPSNMQYISLHRLQYPPILHLVIDRLSSLRFRQGEATCLA